MNSLHKLFSFFVFCFLIGAVRGDVGNVLERTFLLFKSQPLNSSAAEEAGWTSFTDCDPNFGIAYAYSSGGPDADNSPILYYTQSGQLAGFGERVWGQPPEALVGQFWRPVSDGVFDITISTRDPSVMCSYDIFDYENVIGRVFFSFSSCSCSHYLLSPFLFLARSARPLFPSPPMQKERKNLHHVILGDRLMINQEFNIPLTMGDAEKAGWVMGNCINKMGIHHAYDLNQPGGQTWNVSSLVPVQPMYNVETEAISAVLFWMPDLQNIEPLGDWEGRLRTQKDTTNSCFFFLLLPNSYLLLSFSPSEGPFVVDLFCKNWCANSGCTFSDVTVFTTMHWMFTDPDLNSCTGAPCSL
jgi:hypothetical protein